MSLDEHLRVEGRDYLLRVHAECNGNITHMAGAVGRDRKQLYQTLRIYGLGHLIGPDRTKRKRDGQLKTPDNAPAYDVAAPPIKRGYLESGAARGNSVAWTNRGQSGVR